MSVSLISTYECQAGMQFSVLQSPADRAGDCTRCTIKYIVRNALCRSKACCRLSFSTETDSKKFEGHFHDESGHISFSHMTRQDIS